jgi:hypothetical protein
MASRFLSALAAMALYGAFWLNGIIEQPGNHYLAALGTGVCIGSTVVLTVRAARVAIAEQAKAERQQVLR